MNHKEMAVWQEGINLVKGIYQITGKFPKEELYGLTSQIRRAAVYEKPLAEQKSRGSRRRRVSEVRAKVGFEDGLKRTIAWYKNRYQ